jgi:hypothetical protein
LGFVATLFSGCKTRAFSRGDARLHCVQLARAVLIPKGFEALNAIPDALQGKTPLGEKLSHLAAEGTKKAYKAAISEVVGQVIGVAARHLFQP